jgi:L-lactate permease
VFLTWAIVVAVVALVAVAPVVLILVLMRGKRAASYVAVAYLPLAALTIYLLGVQFAEH